MSSLGENKFVGIFSDDNSPMSLCHVSNGQSAQEDSDSMVAICNNTLPFLSHESDASLLFVLMDSQLSSERFSSPGPLQRLPALHVPGSMTTPSPQLHAFCDSADIKPELRTAERNHSSLSPSDSTNAGEQELPSSQESLMLPSQPPLLVPRPAVHDDTDPGALQCMVAPTAAAGGNAAPAQQADGATEAPVLAPGTPPGSITRSPSHTTRPSQKKRAPAAGRKQPSKRKAANAPAAGAGGSQPPEGSLPPGAQPMASKLASAIAGVMVPIPGRSTVMPHAHRLPQVEASEPRSGNARRYCSGVKPPKPPTAARKRSFKPASSLRGIGCAPEHAGMPLQKKAKKEKAPGAPKSIKLPAALLELGFPVQELGKQKGQVTLKVNPALDFDPWELDHTQLPEWLYKEASHCIHRDSHAPDVFRA